MRVVRRRRCVAIDQHLAGRTQSLQLNVVVRQPIACVMDFPDQRALQRWVVKFGDFSAMLADDQDAMATVRQVMANRERIDRFDFVHEASRQEKVERAVHGWRRGGWMHLFHFIENRIRLGRPARGQQKLEHLPAYRRQALATIATISLRQRQSGFMFVRVIF